MRIAWTDAPPSEPGWYWWRWDQRQRPMVVEVCVGRSGMVAYWRHDDPGDAAGGEWAGPIAPPVSE